MFLDSNNCYYIDGIGIYVFWPEIGKILFYEEKTKDKTLSFDNIILEEDSGISKLVFINCKPDQGERRSFTGKLKAFCKRNVDILFYSQNSNNLFNIFFQTEREQKTELLKQRKQIDYLLVIKSSKSTLHTSKEEPRILRIDWANNIIKYYGEDAVFQINDFIVPREVPLDSRFPVYDIDSRMTKPHNSNYQKQLISNGHGHALLKPQELNDSQTDFSTLVEYLKRAGFFPAEYTIEKINKIFDILDSSILKNKWIDTIRTYISDDSRLIPAYLDAISLTLTQAQTNLQKITPIMTLDEKTTAFQYFINDLEQIGDTYTHTYDVNIPTNVGSIINFNFNKDKLLSSQNNSEKSKYKVANCGADNCYFTVNDNTGSKFGLRISSNIYLSEDYGIYNSIIENLINAIMYFYFTNSALLEYKNKLPEISAVLKFGFIKVPFTTIDDIQLEGYIPYTLSEHRPTYKTIMNEINLLSDLALDIDKEFPCYIEKYIKNILAQVYNFNVIARPYFKFSHNDFKTNNILIDTSQSDKPPKIYIIDFGYAQINFSNGNRTYNLTNRINFYNDEQGKKEEYEFLIKNINDIYSTDNDIETLLYWLINPYEFYEKDSKLNESNASNASKFYYHKIMKELLEFIQPLTFKKPQASRQNKTILGYTIYKCPELNYPISLIEYRLCQIYNLINVISTKCNFKPALIETYKSANPYIKYFFGYNNDVYLQYLQYINEIITCAKAKDISPVILSSSVMPTIPVAGAANSILPANNTSIAGGSRIKRTHKRIKKTKKYNYGKKSIISKKRK